MRFINFLALVGLPVLSVALPKPPGHDDETGPGTWSTLAPIPDFPRQEHITVVLSPTTFAIVAGIIPDPQAPGNISTVGLVQIYNSASDSWRSVASAPVPLNHPNAASVNGDIYLLGGLLVAPDGVWRATPDCWIWDSAKDEWRAIAPMPASEARGSAVTAVHDGVIYLAGGMTVLEPFAGGVQGTVDTVSAFDTRKGKWITLPEAARALPEARDHAGGAMVGGKLYVLGGRKEGQHNVKDTVFVLDVAERGRKGLEGGWATKEGRMPTPRGGLVAAAIGDKIFTFGGEGNTDEGSNGVFNQTEVYDTSEDEWEELEPMQLPRHGLSAVAMRGKVYLPGGGTVIGGGGAVDVLDAYTPGHEDVCFRD
ncbi:kelch repeat-containing protein [Podospora conica]|nr:kelch repeat-containing protein [Schizothecium conicum]